MVCVVIKLVVIRNNNGFYVAATEIFLSAFVTRFAALNGKDSKASSNTKRCLTLPYHFKCSLYVLEMFYRKCHNNQTTDYFNLPATALAGPIPFGMSNPIGGNNNNKGGK